jgi:lipopolysaccharide/colanic/teichoic acid biosynthesis glycosyltransferase
MALVALAIKWESGGPILERREQIGQGGQRFIALRFRTTARDPSGWTPRWRTKPTRVGQFLRTSRIDALPQLFNVLSGEMSFMETSLFD